jgi:hypothetical protein
MCIREVLCRIHTRTLVILANVFTILLSPFKQISGLYINYIMAASFQTLAYQSYFGHP